MKIITWTELMMEYWISLVFRTLTYIGQEGENTKLTPRKEIVAPTWEAI
jgi:hypothetical protein